jgi:tetratricopeptide (TPR) repeat protein
VSWLERGAGRSRVELGVAYRARGRLSDALRQFDAAAKLQPSSDLQMLRALTLEAMDRFQEAGQAFRTAWELDSGNPIKAYYVLQRSGTASEADRERARTVLRDTYGRLTHDAHRPVAAPFLVLDAITDNAFGSPVIADAATAGGVALLVAGNYTGAVAALGRAFQASDTPAGDGPIAHFNRGRAAEAENRVIDARREYQSALDGALFGRSTLYVAIARLAQVEGDGPGALDALTRAARLAPNNAYVHKELAAAYAAEGRAGDAFGELMAALLIDGRDAQAHAAIGQLYLDTGREAEGIDAFRRALELSPAGYEVRYALATALTRLGRTEEAAQQLEMFERARREKHEQRRRDIAGEVAREEAVRRSTSSQDVAR